MIRPYVQISIGPALSSARAISRQRKIQGNRLALLRLMSCLILAATLIFGGASAAFAQIRGRITTAVQKSYLYDLKITQLAPGPYVENRPVAARFVLTVKAFGVSGSLPAPVQGRICGARRGNSCRSIGLLSEGRTVTGTVDTSALAGANADFFVYLETPAICASGTECFGSTDLAEASSKGPVAARYMISVSGYQILRPRAQRFDTVKINLFGAVAGQRSSEPDACNIASPPRYCAINVPQGDHNAGTYAAINTEIGPFDIVPETDPDLKFTYIVLNMGTTYEQRVAEAIFNGISDFAAAGLSAYTGSQGGNSDSWSGLNDFTKKMNARQFGGCDGPVAVDMVSALNRAIGGNTAETLYGRTAGTGVWNQKGPREADAYEIDSQEWCGRSGQYRVTWTIRRVSWLPPVG